MFFYNREKGKNTMAIDRVETNDAFNDDASSDDQIFRILVSSLGGALAMMIVLLYMANI